MEEILTFTGCTPLTDKADQLAEAKRIASWALPGDPFDEPTLRFLNSGLTLDPFLEIVVHAHSPNPRG